MDFIQYFEYCLLTKRTYSFCHSEMSRANEESYVIEGVVGMLRVAQHDKALRMTW